MQKYVVFDDLAFCLTAHPVVVPLPPANTSDGATCAFIMETLEKLMRLDVLDGYTERFDRIYPDFSS